MVPKCLKTMTYYPQVLQRLFTMVNNILYYNIYIYEYSNILIEII